MCICITFIYKDETRNSHWNGNRNSVNGQSSGFFLSEPFEKKRGKNIHDSDFNSDDDFESHLYI